MFTAICYKDSKCIGYLDKGLTRYQHINEHQFEDLAPKFVCKVNKRDLSRLWINPDNMPCLINTMYR